MKLIIGLGNPGKRYRNSRHNTGRLVLEALAKELGLESFKISKKLRSKIARKGNLLLAMPETFMNESGSAIAKIVNQYKTKSPKIWVIHDDLDLILGSYKIQKAKGPREHNGLLDIYKKLGFKDFWHVRVGIENRGPDGLKIPGEDYVLQGFSEEEELEIQKTTAKIIEELKRHAVN